MPEPQEHGFVGERRLSDAQISVLARWVAGGKQRGDPAKAPPTPKWSEDWTLGIPDLVLRMPAPWNATPEIFCYAPKLHVDIAARDDANDAAGASLLTICCNAQNVSLLDSMARIYVPLVAELRVQP